MTPDTRATIERLRTYLDSGGGLCDELVDALPALLDRLERLEMVAEAAISLVKELGPDIECNSVTPYAEFYDLEEELKKL